MKNDTKIFLTIKDDTTGETYLEAVTSGGINDAIAMLGAFERRHPEICQQEDVKDF